MKYRSCYEEGKKQLLEAGIQEAALDARLLLEWVCKTNSNDLFVYGEKEVEESQKEAFFDLIEKRKKRVPLQYITGIQNFMGLDFQVNKHVLIPRQDTEILVEEVLKELQDGMRILDMCTGSGCILISLLYYTNGCQGIGVDISEEALQVARQNAKVLLGEKKQQKDVFLEGFEQSSKEKAAIFLQNNLFSELEKKLKVKVFNRKCISAEVEEKEECKFDIIVSNPPYIPSEVIPTLMPEVEQYEPILALDGQEDGLFFYRKIIKESGKYLVRGGWLYLEIGCDQGEEVKELMKEAGFAEIKIEKDYAGLNRVIYGIFLP